MLTLWSFCASSSSARALLCAFAITASMRRLAAGSEVFR